MLFPNATLVFFVLSFLVFMLLLNEWFLKPVGETIEKRKRIIADNAEASKSFQDEAKTLVDNYQRDLALKREEAQSLITRELAEAQRERNKQLTELKEKGRKRLEQSRTELAAEKNLLLDQLVDQEAQLVKQIVGKLLGESAKVEVSSLSVKRALEEAI